MRLENNEQSFDFESSSLYRGHLRGERKWVTDVGECTETRILCRLPRDQFKECENRNQVMSC